MFRFIANRVGLAVEQLSNAVVCLYGAGRGAGACVAGPLRRPPRRQPRQPPRTVRRTTTAARTERT